MRKIKDVMQYLRMKFYFVKAAQNNIRLFQVQKKCLSPIQSQLLSKELLREIHRVAKDASIRSAWPYKACTFYILDAIELQFALGDTPTVEMISLIVPDLTSTISWQVQLFELQTKKHAVLRAIDLHKYEAHIRILKAMSKAKEAQP